MPTMKVGAVTFEHTDGFKGEVSIQRGEKQMHVPVEALKHFVGEAVRQELMGKLEVMKPLDLLRRIA